jgi:hypothetical protein
MSLEFRILRTYNCVHVPPGYLLAARADSKWPAEHRVTCSQSLRSVSQPCAYVWHCPRHWNENRKRATHSYRTVRSQNVLSAVYLRSNFVRLALIPTICWLERLLLVGVVLVTLFDFVSNAIVGRIDATVSGMLFGVLVLFRVRLSHQKQSIRSRNLNYEMTQLTTLTSSLSKSSSLSSLNIFSTGLSVGSANRTLVAVFGVSWWWWWWWSTIACT